MKHEKRIFTLREQRGGRVINVRTFVGKRGEDHFEEIDLDKYVGIVTAEMSGNSIRVKGLRFKRKEDVDVHTRVY